MSVERVDPPVEGTERELLEAFLDYYRATLLLKFDGLDAVQVRRRAVPPSGLSLLGLVRHMAEVERWWFRIVLDGQALEEVFCTPEEPEADFDRVDEADPDADRAAFVTEVDEARAAAARHGLDDVGNHPRGPRSMRWILIHMIEEYARHCGHADLLRECLDGSTGD